jgi:SAM-dependent methyltransferase
MKRKLVALLCWALSTPSVFGSGEGVFRSCPWLVQFGGTEPITAQTRFNTTTSARGIYGLREVFWNNLGELAEAPRPGMDKAIWDISLIDYTSPLLLSFFPGAVRLALLKRDITAIALLVEYAEEPPEGPSWAVPFPDGLKTPKARLFPVLGLLDSTVMDERRFRFLREALTVKTSPYRVFQGNYVNYPIVNNLVHWRSPLGLDHILGKDFQIPAVGPVFIPSNHYSAAVVKHVQDRKLDLSPDKRVLVMGAGAGADSIALAKLGFQVTATDIDPFSRPTVALAAHLAGVSDRVKIVEGNLFENIQGKFPLVVFVAPYPSVDPDQTRDWRTYDKGFYLLNQFYHGLPHHLTQNGSLILMSSAKPHVDQNLPTFLRAEHMRPFGVRLPGLELEYATYQIKLSQSGRAISPD